MRFPWQTKPAPDPDELARRSIQTMLEAGHGFSATRDSDCVVVDRAGRLTCRVTDQSAKGGPSLAQKAIQLDVSWTLPDVPEGRPILTFMSGYGETLSGAVADAAKDWVHRVARPVLEGRAGTRPPDGRMTTTTMRADGSTVEREWELFEGPASSVYVGTPAVPPEELVKGQPLVALAMDAFATAVNELPDFPIHWVKLFLAHIENGDRICELKIDNGDWPDQSRMRDFRWPEHRGVLSLRYFVCAIDVARRPSA